MSEFIKPALLDVVWASAGDKISPNNSKIGVGWEVEIPLNQYANFVENKQDQYIAYIEQHGIPEWSATMEYQAGKAFIQYNGALYHSLSTNTNKAPDVNTSDWVKVWSNP